MKTTFLLNLICLLTTGVHARMDEEQATVLELTPQPTKATPAPVPDPTLKPTIASTDIPTPTPAPVTNAPTASPKTSNPTSAPVSTTPRPTLVPTDPPVVACEDRRWYKAVDGSCTNGQNLEESPSFDTWGECCTGTSAVSYNDSCDEAGSVSCPIIPPTPAPVMTSQPMVSIFHKILQ
mmetsp:Transcript_36374/g.74149  ORF Transcript_36374/g.74149 Transcript_36374/m.74149 type:complete len:179 (-) Transcript_36374:101-637(-)